MPEALLELVEAWAPTAGVVVLVVGTLAGARVLLRRAGARAGSRDFRDQLVMLGLTLAGLIGVVFALPVEAESRSDLLGLLGLLLSAIIALASSTVVGNALAGLVLRAIGNYRLGDFLRVDEHFGRVSERGLFHTEIQTEDRDLTTLPNLFLVTRPFRVVRSTGTVTSATVSIGYDVPHERVRALLLDAARDAGLEDPFVQVRDLGDFSVTYRAAGVLPEVKQLLTARSRLRIEMLDALHAAGIEIASPTLMSTRAYAERHAFVPDLDAGAAAASAAEGTAPEEVVFEKADRAAELEAARAELVEAERRLAAGEDVAALRDELLARVEVLADEVDGDS